MRQVIITFLNSPTKGPGAPVVVTVLEDGNPTSTVEVDLDEAIARIVEDAA
jgi:hypothetical protein